MNPGDRNEFLEFEINKSMDQGDRNEFLELEINKGNFPMRFIDIMVILFTWFYIVNAVDIHTFQK